MEFGVAGGGPPPVKDDGERPVADVWRPVFRSIVRALVCQDYRLIGEIDSVDPVSEETAAHIRGNVAAYGATLVELPDDTWNSSVAMWTGSDWDVLVDLWTAEEGRSDLCLSTRVHETYSGFRFAIYMVYVP